MALKYLLILSVVLTLHGFAFGQDSYHCVEDGLDLGLIHSDPKAFYISMDMDPRGDLYVGGRGQACIDEFEIFGPDSQTNLALAGRASGSSVLPGHASKHQIAFLNDGNYGNPRSWIPAKSTGWAQIKFAESTTIDRVVLSRDREGKLRDRSPANFDICVSSDGNNWKAVKKVRAGKVVQVPQKAQGPKSQ